MQWRAAEGRVACAFNAALCHIETVNAGLPSGEHTLLSSHPFDGLVLLSADMQNTDMDNYGIVAAVFVRCHEDGTYHSGSHKAEAENRECDRNSFHRAKSRHLMSRRD